MTSTASDAKTAEALWARAHDHVKRGDFANAVRDLAQCFQILQALQDPRVYEVHKRWTEVHRMYMEDGQRKPEPVASKAPSLEAEAETAANAGDLDKAIALYRQAQQQNPENELITERLVELTQAKQRADDLVNTKARAPERQPEKPVVVVAEDDWSDVSVEDSGKQPASPAPTDTAPTMAVEDAPVGMQSLDVPFSVGEPIDSFQADDLPVAGAVSTPPERSPEKSPGKSGPDDVAFLEELLLRVKANRAEPRAATS
jgi:tetratricopeptide (TPR) repeat protein